MEHDTIQDVTANLGAFTSQRTLRGDEWCAVRAIGIQRSRKNGTGTHEDTRRTLPLLHLSGGTFGKHGVWLCCGAHWSWRRADVMARCCWHDVDCSARAEDGTNSSDVSFVHDPVQVWQDRQQMVGPDREQSEVNCICVSHKVADLWIQFRDRMPTGERMSWVKQVRSAKELILEDHATRDVLKFRRELDAAIKFALSLHCEGWSPVWWKRSWEDHERTRICQGHLEAPGTAARKGAWDRGRWTRIRNLQ